MVPDRAGTDSRSRLARRRAGRRLPLDVHSTVKLKKTGYKMFIRGLEALANRSPATMPPRKSGSLQIENGKSYASSATFAPGARCH
jgi:hypothetical protein